MIANGRDCACPFSKADQLDTKLSDAEVENFLPGHPRIEIDDQNEVLRFVKRDIYPTDLECMAGKLWWMAKQDSSSITPLHRQLVKGRAIIITEDPKLHLTWIRDRVFIKPIPKYLLSYGFWTKYLSGDTKELRDLRKAAMGFMRSYFYLIQHESDMRIAQDEKLSLIPTNMTWNQFCSFSSGFVSIQDQDVIGRYTYGEIRLTRLNLYGKFLLRRWHFQRIHYQSSDYFANFYAPILFVMGMISIILSAMQLEIGVEQIDSLMSWPTFRTVCRGFSVTTLVALVALMLVLALLLIVRIGAEWHYALQDRYNSRRRKCAKLLHA